MNTTRFYLAAGAALLLTLGMKAQGRAMTLSVSPNPASVNQTVIVDGAGFLTDIPSGRIQRGSSRLLANVCEIQIRYGDGRSFSQGFDSGQRNQNCEVHTTHTYAAPGTYDVVAEGICGEGSTIAFSAPTRVQRQLVVQAPLGSTPAAPVVTSAASANRLDLQRMELTFGNNRPEIVVQRGETDLKARVRLRYEGSGILLANWEVDGRALVPPVSKHLTLGERVELESPLLPTFDPGTHRVRFVITSPAPPTPLPEIMYLVRPSETAPRDLAINLAAPVDGATLPYQPAIFRWVGGDGVLVYLVHFYQEGSEEPIFSAWSKSTEYRLPELLYRSHFLAGGRYRWKVSGFNADENIAGTSPAKAFSFARE